MCDKLKNVKFLVVLPREPRINDFEMKGGSRIVEARATGSIATSVTVNPFTR